MKAVDGMAKNPVARSPEIERTLPAPSVVSPTVVGTADCCNGTLTEWSL